MSGIARAALILTSAMMLLVSLWSAWSVPEVAARWFALPNLLWLAPVPLLTLTVIVGIWWAIWNGREAQTFVLSLVLFALGLFGLVVSMWPYVVPRQVTVWDGLSDPRSLAFLGVGVMVIIPVVLAYQAHAYWIFRGKVQHEAGPGGYG